DFGKSGRYQIRVTAYGAFIEDKKSIPDEQGKLKRGYIPDDLDPDQLTDEIAEKQVAAGMGIKDTGKVLGRNPDNGFEIKVVNGPYGPYFTEIIPEGVPTKGKGAVKPKRGSLLKDMEMESVTLEDALKVFELPRNLGVNPSDGEKIVVNNGRFGPYLMKKDPATKKYDYRSIKKTETESAEERMFTITLDEAIEIYSHPKVYRRGRKGTKKK
ncbi:MAG: hypothetical protein LBM13_00700, partial [Candidatus Ancillula sp.]|nr:hypothetical protein [Candidatus Ancillula sp.]